MGKPFKHDPQWVKAKQLCRLNQDDIAKAKALGLTPKALMKNIPSPHQKWKQPVKQWIRELHAKKFGGGIAAAGPKRAKPEPIASRKSQADDYAPAARDNVMYGFLNPGERRLPFAGQARDAVPDSGSNTHYMFTPLNIGTLPGGKSITITFRVTIATLTLPLTPLVSSAAQACPCASTAFP